MALLSRSGEYWLSESGEESFVGEDIFVQQALRLRLNSQGDTSKVQELLVGGAVSLVICLRVQIFEDQARSYANVGA